MVCELGSSVLVCAGGWRARVLAANHMQSRYSTSTANLSQVLTGHFSLLCTKASKTLSFYTLFIQSALLDHLYNASNL